MHIAADLGTEFPAFPHRWVTAIADASGSVANGDLRLAEMEALVGALVARGPRHLRHGRTLAQLIRVGGALAKGAGFAP